MTSKTFDKKALKETLSPTAYHVTQEEGTERAFSGELWDNKAEGSYNCVVCGTPLTINWLARSEYSVASTISAWTKSLSIAI